ncbi:MAG: leucine-rich repeat domain-containing protein [Clostridia bacterium]|nr:leucine-rich repeat domain-containing protein [Clostridia bacterium]
MKRVFSLLSLILILSFALLCGCELPSNDTPSEPQPPQKQTTVIQNGVTYTLLEDDTYEITAFDGSTNVVVIPELVKELPVTSVGAKAFNNKKTIKSVTLPNSVKTIKQSAFANCKLLTTFVGAGVETIGVSAFTACSSLTTFDFTSVKTIENKAFDSANLGGEQYLPSVETIGQWAFSYCRTTVFKTGDKMQKVYLNSFAGCKASLNKVEFANNQQEWCLWLTYVGGTPGWWDNDKVVSGTIPWKEWIKSPEDLSNLLTEKWNDGSFIATRGYRNQFPNGESN